MESLSQKDNPDLKKFMTGVGLRTEHYSFLEENPPSDIDYFEAISENHMNSKGRPWEILEIIRKDYPLSFHGVSLNIGLASELNQNYLKKLKEMVDTFDPILVSDHLCWTGKPKTNFHNLLPFAYTEENLEHVASKVSQTMDFLKRPIALENLSAYFQYKDSTMKEWDFFSRLIEKTGCLMLLDVNNIYVNSVNQKFDPKEFVDAIPLERVAEIHLAGFTDMGDFLFDTHSKPVYPEVWELYKYVLSKRKNIPTLIEWDDDIPAFPTLKDEAMKAKQIFQELSL